MRASQRRPFSAGQAIWTPTDYALHHSLPARYMSWLRAERGLDFADYDALWQWSVDDPEGFWSSVWEYFQIQAHAPYERVLGSRKMPGAEWFPGARLNYAEHLVGRDEDEDSVAIVAR